jgi:hypothetical protein
MLLLTPGPLSPYGVRELTRPPPLNEGVFSPTLIPGL